VAHVPLCRACLQRVLTRGATDPLAPSILEARRIRYDRWSLVLAYGGLLIRTAFYALLFVWAGRSTTGAAILEGVVAADVLSWLILGAFRIPFEGFEVTVDGVFQFLLIVFFLNRDALFSIDETAEIAAASFLSFLAFVVFRLAIWGAENALESVADP
jgi:hypothetical protein